MDKKNEFKNKLRSNSELPESLSWDNVGQDILHGVKPNNKKRKYGLIFIWIGILLFVFSGLLLISNLKMKNNSLADLEKKITENHENIKVILDEVKKSIDPITIESNNKSDSNAKSGRSSSSNNNEKSLKNNAIEKVSNSINKQEKIEEQKTENYHSAVRNNMISEGINNATYDLEADYAEVNIENSTQEIPHIIPLSNAQSEIADLDEITTIEVIRKLLVFERTQLLFPNIDPLYIIETKEGTNPYWMSSLGLSTSYMLPNFNGNKLAETKSILETGFPSIGLGLNIAYVVNGKWSFSTGLHYRNIESKFDFTQERDTSMVQEVNVELLNTLTHTVTSHSIDSDVQGVAYTRVLKYNKYKQLSLPMSVSRIHNVTRKFGISYGLGTQLTYHFGNEGQTVVENIDPQYYNVISIEESNNYKKISSQITTNFGIEYNLTQRVWMGLHSGIEYTISNLTKETHSFNPIVFSGQLKLSYKL